MKTMHVHSSGKARPGAGSRDRLGRVDGTAALAMFQALQQTDEFDARLSRLVRASPRRGSLGRVDARSNQARFVLVFAHQAAAVATDHLKTWRLLVEGLVHPVFAQMTLLRGAMEGAATTRWLIDPNASSDERVARGMATVIEDRRQRAAFEKDAGLTVPERDPTAKSGRERYEEFRAIRHAEGIREIPYPAFVDLQAQYGGSDGLWLYRLVSAFAHAKEWALHATDKAEFDDRRTAGGVSVGRVEASDQIVLFATVHAVQAVATAITDLEGYLVPKSLRRQVRGP